MVICRAAVPDKEREASAELADDFGMDEQMSPLAGRQNIEFTNRQLVSLILPMLAEQLLGITVGLADSLMVATVGDASISAVSLVDSVSALMIYIFSAMATPAARSWPVSTSAGASGRRPAAARSSSWCCSAWCRWR